jgi:hypothetical protein
MSGQHSVLGDMKTRLCLHVEILSERCIDQCGDFAHRMRKPLLALSAAALFLTMRAAQKSIRMTKATGIYDGGGGPPGYSAPYDIPGAYAQPAGFQGQPGGVPGQPGGMPPPPKSSGGWLSSLTNKRARALSKST